LWIDWGTRLITILALLTIIIGLVVLALPDPQEGREMIRLDATHCLRVADLIGAALVAIGALLIWAALLAWQRKRIEQ
jgi:drug/metabolite transporter (DMT)-like permease